MRIIYKLEAVLEETNIKRFKKKFQAIIFEFSELKWRVYICQS